MGTTSLRGAGFDLIAGIGIVSTNWMDSTKVLGLWARFQDGAWAGVCVRPDLVVDRVGVGVDCQEIMDEI
jgi:hypothetical protein